VSILYASAALKLVGIPAQLSALCTAIPLIQLSEGLPITLSGLGTREAILLYLLQPDRTEPILAFGLLWSTELVVGRLAIGLGLMWFGAMPGRFGDEGQGVSKRLPQKPGVSTTD
jgi:hypothetical protein